MQKLQHLELNLKLCEDTFCPLCHFGVKVGAPISVSVPIAVISISYLDFSTQM